MALCRRELLRGVGLLGVMLAGSPAFGQVNAAVIPLRLGRSRIIVDAVIDGAQPVPLILDTGAHISLIAESFAKSHKMREVGRTPAVIAGTRDRFPVVEAKKVVITGGVDVGSVAFAVLPVPALGEGSVGSISGGLVTILDSQMDFPNSRILIFPNGGPPRTGWTRHDRGIVRERTGTAYLDATAMICGTKVAVRLDTGSPTPLLLSSATLRRVVPGASALNWSPVVGKDGAARLVRLPGPLAIGDLQVDRPLVRLRNGDEAFGKDLVGYPVIRQLDIATATKEGAFYTRANGLKPDPRDYNMSGLYVGRRGAELFAEQVGKGSPAEAAGIRVGDPLAGLDFRPMITALNGAEGQTVKLSVAGRRVELILRDYL